jgi:hypothetical protein
MTLPSVLGVSFSILPTPGKKVYNFLPEHLLHRGNLLWLEHLLLPVFFPKIKTFIM